MSRQTSDKDHPVPESVSLMEHIVKSENMKEAFRRVKANRGSAGIDNMTVEDAVPFLRKHWPQIKGQLRTGKYIPKPVKRVEIDKPNGGKRMLGVPTVVDRTIQQAIHQILNPIFDPCFSDHSFGFRPGRSAHQAVTRAKEYISRGNRWVVDIDLKSFFDEVNHDRLMSLIAKKVQDKHLLRLIRRYLTAGVMLDGMVNASKKGTPQGGPLSPLLSNIVLDELDKELERRGHLFCRYADDCNIYVKSRRAGERVMKSLSSFLEKKLLLKVNHDKSGVDRPWKRKFLGYTYTWHKNVKLRVAKESIKRFKANIKTLCRRGRGMNLTTFVNTILNPAIRGWINYFKLSDVKKFAEELDGWIRRRLRCILWRQWKRPATRARKLMKFGLSEERAWTSALNGRGAWWNSGASHMNGALKKKFFDQIGLISMLDQLLGFRTA